MKSHDFRLVQRASSDLFSLVDPCSDVQAWAADKDVYHTEVKRMLEREGVLFGEASSGRRAHFLLQALPPSPCMLPRKDCNCAYQDPHKETNGIQSPVLELPLCTLILMFVWRDKLINSGC